MFPLASQLHPIPGDGTNSAACKGHKVFMGEAFSVLHAPMHHGIDAGEWAEAGFLPLPLASARLSYPDLAIIPEGFNARAAEQLWHGQLARLHMETWRHKLEGVAVADAAAEGPVEGDDDASVRGARVQQLRFLQQYGIYHFSVFLG
eukprot:4051306-Alexandrium_andersonii.AAC.1